MCVLMLEKDLAHASINQQRNLMSVLGRPRSSPLGLARLQERSPRRCQPMAILPGLLRAALNASSCWAEQGTHVRKVFYEQPAQGHPPPVQTGHIW